MRKDANIFNIEVTEKYYNLSRTIELFLTEHAPRQGTELTLILFHLSSNCTQCFMVVNH